MYIHTHTHTIGRRTSLLQHSTLTGFKKDSGTKKSFISSVQKSTFRLTRKPLSRPVKSCCCRPDALFSLCLLREISKLLGRTSVQTELGFSHSVSNRTRKTVQVHVTVLFLRFGSKLNSPVWFAQLYLLLMERWCAVARCDHWSQSLPQRYMGGQWFAAVIGCCYDT